MEPTFDRSEIPEWLDGSTVDIFFGDPVAYNFMHFGGTTTSREYVRRKRTDRDIEHDLFDLLHETIDGTRVRGDDALQRAEAFVSAWIDATRLGPRNPVPHWVLPILSAKPTVGTAAMGPDPDRFLVMMGVHVSISETSVGVLVAPRGWILQGRVG